MEPDPANGSPAVENLPLAGFQHSERFLAGTGAPLELVTIIIRIERGFRNQACPIYKLALKSKIFSKMHFEFTQIFEIIVDIFKTKMLTFEYELALDIPGVS